MTRSFTIKGEEILFGTRKIPIIWLESSLETFGSLYYKFKDRFERIEKTFDSNNFFVWKVLGDIYYKNEKYEEAKDNYLLALKKAPRDSHIWLHLGLIFIHMKEFEQAEKHLKMVLKIDPEAFPAQFGLAGVYYKTQNYDTALELINEVLKHVPDDKHIIKFREKIQNKLKA